MITSKIQKLKADFSTAEKDAASHQDLPRIVVILGPTSSGKSALSVHLAREIGADIISADSRQIYKGLDIGTGKITKKEMFGVPHHMLDVVSPRTKYSAGKFKKEAEKIISEVIKRKKVPIVVGGTGFYIQALVYGLIFPEVKADAKLRAKLTKKSVEELLSILKKLDSERAKNIDRKNKVRLVRAIEIAKVLGKVPEIKKDLKYNPLLVGIDLPDKILKLKIKKRLLERARKGMIKEAEELRRKGLSFRRMEELGLEYRYLAKLLKKEIDKKTFLRTLEKEIWQYVKRQRTWFRKDKNVKWFRPSEYVKIKQNVREFLS